jgi:hypothetical protein
MDGKTAPNSELAESFRTAQTIQERHMDLHPYSDKTDYVYSKIILSANVY